MIEIYYMLHTDDGGIESEEIQTPLVPRVGELVTSSQDRSFQVVDVLWHHTHQDSSTSVTVTACELNWHQHIRDVTDQWRRAKETSS